MSSRAPPALHRLDRESVGGVSYADFLFREILGTLLIRVRRRPDVMDGPGIFDAPLDLPSLRAELARRDETFERDTGVKSARTHIAADSEWEFVYQSLKRAELQIAEQKRTSGQCAQYIPRRRRFCASRAGDGKHTGFCSLHATDLSRTVVSRPEQEGSGADDDDGETSDVVFDKESGGSDKKNPIVKKKTNIHRRMKKLTNPMALHHRRATACPNWCDVFADSSLPLFIDIGCAKGRFLQKCASVDRERFESFTETKMNLLGLEIYAPIVLEANRWTKSHTKAGKKKQDAGDGNEPGGDAVGNAEDGKNDDLSHAWTKNDDDSIDNLHFVACNANVTLRAWFGCETCDASRINELQKCQKSCQASSAERGHQQPPKIGFVTILFPDPWSRRKHASRRVVTPEFVNTLSLVLEKGRKVYCASDVLALAREMQGVFRCDENFTLDEQSFACFGEATEKELIEKCESASGGGKREATNESAENTEENFNHVFPAHQYRWQAPGNNAETSPESFEAPSNELAGDDETEETADASAFTFDPRQKPRWLTRNPLGVPTERDLVCEGKWRPVWRFVVVRV